LPSITHRRSAVAVTAALLAGATALTGVSSTAAPAQPDPSRPSDAHRAVPSQARGFFDSRTAGGTATVAKNLRAKAQAGGRQATEALATGVDGALLDLDPQTGTPRLLGKLDGYLTDPSTDEPAKVALDYVGAHLAALGLESRDLGTFRLRDDYVDITGTHHLSWYQKFKGMPVFASYGLQAAVDDAGRLLMLGGSPIPSALVLGKAVAPASSLTSRGAAISAARRVGDESRVAPGRHDSVKEVSYLSDGHVYRAWQTITMSADQPAMTIQDAATGALLYRRPLGQSEHSQEAAPGDATGRAFEGYSDETPKNVNFTQLGWLSGDATTLDGNNAHAYSDLNDDNTAQAGEEVPPSTGSAWDYAIQPFQVTGMDYCGNPFPCTWDPETPYSWRANREQNTTQVFDFVNKFHDVLESAPIGFTEAAGNFQSSNTTGEGEEGDAVNTNTLDGASLDHGMPDGSHLDNANMDTPPDGTPPTMQMYLQHQPGTAYSLDGDPFPANNTGDEADTVYHEYTHGLSNRLVISATGESSIGGVQAGAMGEAWSDFYALSYLVDQGIRQDKPGVADLWLGEADGLGKTLVRYQPIDCAVNDSSPDCTGGETGHTGGFTYADYGKVYGAPEVHADGEIWGETLWDLKRQVGYDTALSLVTRAMELSPYDPSMLDERNAILMADTAVFGGAHHAVIWKTFADRGMGFYAGALGGEDAQPAASFDVPPATTDTGTIHGRMIDRRTHKPIRNAPVTLAFQGADSLVNPTAVTNRHGRYTLGPVPVGQYGQLTAHAKGYEHRSISVTVTPEGARQDFSLVRDWAARSGGAKIVNFNGPDYTDYGCGPGGAIDLSYASGWGSTTGRNSGAPTNTFVPKFLVVKLPARVNVKRFAIDPAATCGDGASASTGRFRVETSRDGKSWRTAAHGRFTSGDRGRANPVRAAKPARHAVRFVRLTILGNQTPDFATNCPDGAYSGCQYTDLTEFEVLGASTR
jgi:hypothetical protein